MSLFSAKIKGKIEDLKDGEEIVAKNGFRYIHQRKKLKYNTVNIFYPIFKKGQLIRPIKYSRISKVGYPRVGTITPGKDYEVLDCKIKHNKKRTTVSVTILDDSRVKRTFASSRFEMGKILRAKIRIKNWIENKYKTI